jgi:hypothetical protein
MAALGWLEIGRIGILVVCAVELAKGVAHIGLILFVGGRQEKPIVWHFLDVAFRDAEGGVPVLDFLVRRMQACKALVGIDSLLVVATGEFGVGKGKLG